MTNMPQDAWGFIVHLYAQDGVQSACLNLQKHGADVCLLLFAAWLEQQAVECSAPYITQLQAQSTQWQQKIISFIRSARINTKEMAENQPDLNQWRAQIKKLELEIEHLYIQALVQLSQNWQRNPDNCGWLTLLFANHAPQLAPIRKCLTAWTRAENNK